MAKLVGVSTDTANGWERARTFPSTVDLWKLCHILNVNAGWILLGDPRGLDRETYKSLVLDANPLA